MKLKKIISEEFNNILFQPRQKMMLNENLDDNIQVEFDEDQISDSNPEDFEYNEFEEMDDENQVVDIEHEDWFKLDDEKPPSVSDQHDNWFLNKL